MDKALSNKITLELVEDGKYHYEDAWPIVEYTVARLTELQPPTTPELEPWSIYNGVLTNRATLFIRLNSTTADEYEQAKLYWHEVDAEPSDEEYNAMVELEQLKAENERMKEAINICLKPYKLATPNTMGQPYFMSQISKMMEILKAALAEQLGEGGINATKFKRTDSN